MRRAVPVAVALALACGCYERTWFYPAPGQGSLVTSGRRLGVAHRLSGEDTRAESFIVLSVEQAYTAAAEEPGLQRAIIQVTANAVNRAAAPARFDVEKTRLEVAGRSFEPKWSYRQGARPEDANEVPPNSSVRFDMYFDLGGYPPGRYAGGAPPLEGGIPLATLTEFNVSWRAAWAGEEATGSFRFVRDYTGRAGAGWAVAPGPYWGYGWWYWPYPWPTGIVIYRAYFPWRYYRYVPHHPYYKVKPGVTVVPHVHVKAPTGVRVKVPRIKVK